MSYHDDATILESGGGEGNVGEESPPEVSKRSEGRKRSPLSLRSSESDPILRADEKSRDKKGKLGRINVSHRRRKQLSNIFVKKIERTRKAPLRKLLLRPKISIKKRTLFLSYMVTHGNGVLVSGKQFAERTGFAQINVLGKLVSSWCRMSDSDMSDSQLGESLCNESQRDDSQIGGDGTLVPSVRKSEEFRQHQCPDGSSDEASPLKSESLRDETEVTLLDDEDEQARSSSSGKSYERDSLCDDDNDDGGDDEARKGGIGLNGRSLSFNGSSRHSSALSESSIEMNQQCYGYNDGFLLQSFLSRSFSLENYRRSQERELSSSSNYIGPFGDSDDANEDHVSLRNLNEANTQYVGTEDVSSGQYRQSRGAAFDNHFQYFAGNISTTTADGGNGVERDLADGDPPSRFDEIPRLPSFVRRRNDVHVGYQDRHLAEYTIAYGEDQSAPLHLRQFSHDLGQVILEQSLAEIDGSANNGVSDGQSMAQIAEELTRNVMSAALHEVSRLTENDSRSGAEEEDLDQITARMSERIIEDSEKCILKIFNFADKISRDVLSTSLEVMASDYLEDQGDAQQQQSNDGDALQQSQEVEEVNDNGGESGGISEDVTEDSVEQMAREDEASNEILDLPISVDDDLVTRTDACVGSDDHVAADGIGVHPPAKVIIDACTQTSAGEENPSPILDGKYLENQWYPLSDVDEEDHRQKTVAGLWKAFSRELESNSQFLRSEELLEYFSESGGIDGAVDESSSVSLREHLQSQLSTSDELSIPQCLERNSASGAPSTSER